MAGDTTGRTVLVWRAFDGAHFRLQARPRTAAGALGTLQFLTAAAGTAPSQPQVSLADGGAATAECGSATTGPSSASGPSCAALSDVAPGSARLRSRSATAARTFRVHARHVLRAAAENSREPSTSTLHVGLGGARSPSAGRVAGAAAISPKHSPGPELCLLLPAADRGPRRPRLDHEALVRRTRPGASAPARPGSPARPASAGDPRQLGRRLQASNRGTCASVSRPWIVTGPAAPLCLPSTSSISPSTPARRRRGRSRAIIGRCARWCSRRAGTPLEPAELADPEPGPGQVLLRVLACGVCRTDLHIVDGELDRAKAAARARPSGRRARWSAPGGRGAVRRRRRASACRGSAGPDGECRYCRSGRENLCPRAVHRLRRRRRLRRARGRRRALLPRARPADAGVETAPLLCAGLIGYRALRMCGDAERLGLYGFGASAHLVCQVAAHQGRRVFAITRAGRRREAGASPASSGAEWAGAADELPEQLDAAIIFAPAGELVPVGAARAGAGRRRWSAPEST